MSEENTAVEPAVEIIRGRMPVAMVYCIRFLEEGSDSELARKYRTTNGKVSDIKKGRNFGYVVEDTKFTQDEIDAAKERASQLDDADDVVSKLDGMGVATEEEAKAAEEARKSTRKPRGKKAEAEDDAPEGTDESSDDEGDDDVDLEDLIN